MIIITGAEHDHREVEPCIKEASGKIRFKIREIPFFNLVGHFPDFLSDCRPRILFLSFSVAIDNLKVTGP